MIKFFSTLFGDSNESYLRRLQPVVDAVNNREESCRQLSDSQLRESAVWFHKKLEQGETLDGILPDAFARTREASRRTLGQRHFDVQLLGGIALHQGRIAEMKTGEGKTLVATLSAFLNALEGKGVHIVTVNDYLAKRDAVWMGQVYDALGLSVGCIVHDASYVYDPFVQEKQEDKERDIVGGFKVVERFLRPVTRKEAYAADITYGTNNEFGFDYLRDNMARSLDEMTQRGHSFVIIDEVDSILIDEARTPLIISAPNEESSHWYKEFARIIPRLRAKEDYEVDEKMRAVTITDSGIDAIERELGVGDLYEEKGVAYIQHLEQALKAEVLFKRDKDYVVKDGQIVIVDEFTGRLLPGRRYSGGLHQALEAKEGVFVQPESLTLASITFQNLFRMYGKIAGMTGTAATSAEEFYKVYKLEVALIPTNKKLVRKDLPDKVYKTEKEKFRAVVQEIIARHKQGQPVLVGTASIEKNELLNALLEREGISHQVLNAKHHEQEGEIIAQAGRRGAVTIATNMAGRGVDIVLGGNPSDPGEARVVRELGGLHVIGTGRHEARRIDNQLRGRSGRQGDTGSSQFFVSLEDDLIRVFGGDRIKGLMERFHFPDDEPIESSMVSRAIESAQSKIEGFNFDTRKHLLEYDDVLNKHRETIYRRRNEILERFQNGTLGALVADLLGKAGQKFEEYGKKIQNIKEEETRFMEKTVLLRAIDSLWVEHLENMEELRDSVRLRAYGQQDPLVEYKHEGHKMFKRLLETVDALSAQALMHGGEISSPPVSIHPAAPEISSFSKVGRNDPCPCGSGKKYKKCHGK
ncbi:MAG: preprotein translocase subunit SecA [Candidatus Wildermuthbacteria bacterium]|nr:preprotein translocase subunit SecA [Candidatus Wildermuthbacteria bacterium]